MVLGLTCVVGFVYMLLEGLDYLHSRKLVSEGRVIVGEVISEEVIRSSSRSVGEKRSGKKGLKVRYEIALSCCEGRIVRELVAREEWRVARDGTIKLLWDGKCPPHMVFQNHPYTGTENFVFGATLVVAGFFGFVATGKKLGR